MVFETIAKTLVQLGRSSSLVGGEEWLRRWRRLGQEKIRAMFQKYDQDSNGGIDKREFHLLLQELGFFKDMPVDKQQKVSFLSHSASAARTGDVPWNFDARGSGWMTR